MVCALGGEIGAQALYRQTGKRETHEGTLNEAWKEFLEHCPYPWPGG